MKQISYPELKVTSPAFEHDGFIPRKYTGRGEDVSPELILDGLLEGAVSIAVIMDDMNHPVPAYNHWVIWNLPAQQTMPENIPNGAVVESLGGAVQGIGYGKHRYRGPKPPFFLRKAHRYRFHVYVLDCKLTLDSTAKKAALLQAMEGHILQYGTTSGFFKNSDSK